MRLPFGEAAAPSSPRLLPSSLPVAIVGSGPAGLMAAEVLAARGVPVMLFDAMPSVGRKLLMAGRGGLNLTHGEALPAFLDRYGAARPLMERALARFSPDDLREWCRGLGIDTFVGSSGRIFPAGLKASPLLRAWLGRLGRLGVILHVRHRWRGFDEETRPGESRLLFDTPDGPRAVDAAATVLALGGASWPRLGSDGGWVPVLEARGVPLSPLLPANCGFEVPWSAHFRERFAGAPLKNLALTAAGRTVRGELMVTGYGIEGGAIYAVSAALRDTVLRDGAAEIRLDLRPQLTVEALAARLAQPRGAASLATVLRKAAGLTGAALAILREGTSLGPTDPAALARRIKALPLTVTAPRPIGRAISSAGGIRLDALDDHLMLRRLPGVFAAGEMLDWEAPTGGYLLQGCFATGILAAEGVLARLGIQDG